MKTQAEEMVSNKARKRETSWRVSGAARRWTGQRGGSEEKESQGRGQGIVGSLVGSHRLW